MDRKIRAWLRPLRLSGGQAEGKRKSRGLGLLLVLAFLLLFLRLSQGAFLADRHF